MTERARFVLSTLGSGTIVWVAAKGLSYAVGNDVPTAHDIAEKAARALVGKLVIEVLYKSPEWLDSCLHFAREHGSPLMGRLRCLETPDLNKSHDD